MLQCFILLCILEFWLVLRVAARDGESKVTGPLGVLHHRTYFYVGGNYVRQNDSSIMQDSIYVERLIPERVTQPLPLLIIHGNGMTGTNFLNTPDGRPGWADFFLRKGYEIYIIDQPDRGRSPYQKDVNGPQSTSSVFTIESRFTATQLFNLWPQAGLHTQWPGNGSMGDPIFDAFYASIVPSISSDVETSMLMKKSGPAMLSRIGPVILLTHSQSGPLGWILADSRPDLIKSIVALEPSGPPFFDVIFNPQPQRAFGIAGIPVEYNPPLSSSEDLQREIFKNSSIFTCFQQASPPRQLVNIAKVPVLIITSESSYHAVYDDCTVNYLRQAGVKVEYMNLKDVGIHGNGHMMFMEKNNIAIAELVDSWFTRAVHT